jgi:hypothetical protein
MWGKLPIAHQNLGVWMCGVGQPNIESGCGHARYTSAHPSNELVIDKQNQFDT